MMSPGPARTRPPPYFAVIFTSHRTDKDHGYSEMADRMVALAGRQPGFLGVESVRGPDGHGITVSYWESREAIHGWKQNLEHQIAQERGMTTWYQDYRVRIATVEYEYGT